MPRVRFRVRGWMGEEEFKGVMAFSRYLGRSGGLSVFEIDPLKMEKEGYSMRDVYARLSSIEGVVEEDLEAIRSMARRENLVEVWMGSDGWLRIGGRVYLKDLLYSKVGVRLPYMRDEKAYKAPPHLYYRLLKLFKESGYEVEDRLGLIGGGRLARDVGFMGQLRPYQEEALKAWVENDYRGVIALPTGAGKTVVAIAGVSRLNVKTLIVVYTKEHVKQWVDAFKRFTDAGNFVGAFYGEEKRIAPITVTTYQTAFKKVSIFAKNYPLVVFDEAHHLPAEKFRAIASMMPAPFRMGLSATIEREDGAHEDIFPMIGGVVYHTEPGELTRHGYLAPFVIQRVRVDLLPEEKNRYEELRKKFKLLAGERSFQELLESARRGDRTAIEALKVHAKMREVVQDSRAKIEEAVKIARREQERGSKVIVFTQYKSQAERIAEKLGALLLHGGLPARERARALQSFKNQDSGILVVTTVGDEGLDIPDANVGIFVSGTGSRRQFIQRLGRLLRPGEGKRAVLYEIIAAKTSEEYQSRRRRGLVK